jgi:hypothetical protein
MFYIAQNVLSLVDCVVLVSVFFSSTVIRFLLGTFNLLRSGEAETL